MQRLLVVTAATLLLTPHPIAQSTALFVLGLAALVSMLFFTVPIPEYPSAATRNRPSPGGFQCSSLS